MKLDRADRDRDRGRSPSFGGIPASGHDKGTRWLLEVENVWLHKFRKKLAQRDKRRRKRLSSRMRLGLRGRK